MKFKLIFLLFIFLGVASQIYAQQKDTVINLDQLRAPSSPALNMLGISSNDIERPTNPTDFALSLGNATSNFSAVPQSFALEVAPFWVLGGKSKFEEFIDHKNIGNNIKHTAMFSIGSSTAKSIMDSSQYRQIAIALKFSIFRGKVGDEFKTWDRTVSQYLAMSAQKKKNIRDSLATLDDVVINPLLKLYAQYQTTDPDKAKEIDQRIKTIEKASNLKTEELFKADSIKNKFLLTKLSELSKQTSFKRYGFKMDWAAGTVVDYPDSTFNQSYLSKFATWLTAGYEAKDGSNILFLLRYAANFNRFYRNDVNQIVKDINIGNLDMGVRVFKDFSDNFTLSLEYINRIPFYSNSNYAVNKVTGPSRTEKYDVSLNYKVSKNQNISFTYGKNFDNIITKGGNLIAALNYIIGFGSSRGTNN